MADVLEQLDPAAETPTCSPVVQVRGLSASFRTDGTWLRVVKDISFAINPQETLAVVGESGSGKSVTALSIMRLLPKVNSRVEGEIELNGRNLLDLSEEGMRKVCGNEVSMIFQEPMTSLNPVLTIGFQVAEALRYHRGMDGSEAERGALELLEQVRIPNARGRFNDYPHLFSGGMRQRVMIAMALACRPSLLIADEPTTALDVTIQAQILDLIKMLQRDIGMSVLFITHDMGVVAEVADRVVVMWRGEAVEEGSTEEIFDSPSHPYTKALLNAVPRLGSMKGIPLPRSFPRVSTPQVEGEDAPRLALVEPEASEEESTVRDSQPPVLEVSGLTTRFDVRAGLFGRLKGRIHAVEDVSFSIRRGETLSLMGESGCGKSTTGRSILSLVKPTSGRVRFDGKDVLDVRARDLLAMRRDMQMIFQDPFASLNPRKMIGPAIAEPMLVHGVASHSDVGARVAELLQSVGLLPEHALRYPHEFSGGQRQRICIARALGLSPKLIVADEAVSALDVSIQAQVVNLLMDLQRELGLAYLFISHDIAVVERISHRVAVMYLGEIVEIGPRQMIFENPSHPYTQKLMAAVPIPDPRQRRRASSLASDEVPSPMRPPDYERRPRPFIEVSPGHYVQDFEDDWNNAAD